VEFSVCGESRNWVRPSLAEQLKKLHSDSRYRDFTRQEIQDDLLWQNQIFLLKNYGLSLFIDFVYLSGIWAIPPETYSKCTEIDEEVLKINSGELVYVILLHNKVKKIELQNGQYLMIVEPTKKGIEFVQFSRLKGKPTIPIKVVQLNGEELIMSESEFISGWHLSKSP
jgi:hypothetical protein